MKITFEIEKCNQCPFHKTTPYYSWEYAVNYICEKANRQIAGYIEWDDELPEVPNWCPIAVKD